MPNPTTTPDALRGLIVDRSGTTCRRLPAGQLRANDRLTIGVRSPSGPVESRLITRVEPLDGSVRLHFDAADSHGPACETLHPDTVVALCGDDATQLVATVVANTRTARSARR